MAKKLKLGNDLINAVKEIILNTSYPVGRIIVSIDNVNPGTYLGGTWVSWGTGRVPVGVDASQTEFNTVEKTGGSKYLQKHRHETNYGTSSSSASYGSGFVYTGVDGHNYAMVHDTGTGDSGNLQPYITCYMWKRTA